MVAPLACVWWPHAGPPTQQPLAAWLRHFSPYVEASSWAPGLFFLDATGLDGLFVCQMRWAQALWHALTTSAPLPAAHASPVHVHIGHHKVSLWALARSAQQQRDAPTSPQMWSTPLAEHDATSALPLEALGLPQATLAAACRMRLYRVREVCSLSLPSVHQHIGEPLSAWLRAWRAPSTPLSRSVPLAPATSHLDLEWPTNDHVQLLFSCRALIRQLMQQAQDRRQHVASLHVACRYEGRTPPAPLLRYLELPEPTREPKPWEDALRLWLEHAPWAGRVSAVAMRGHMVWPKRPEQLVLWPDQPLHEREAMLEALAKIRSAWGSHAVTVAELRASHVPEDRFAWRAWQGEALPTSTVPAVRAQDPERLGRLPRVRLLWPTPRPMPTQVMAILRGDPTTQDAWWRGPYRINVGWWRAVPCDRDYVYIGRQRDAPLLAYFDRQQRRWWWQGLVD